VNITALKSVVSILGGEKIPKCDSMSLRLEKFVRLGNNTKKEEINEVVKKSQGRIPVIAPNGAVSFTAKLGGRLIVNQAGGVLENAGLCIHSHFNAPYIPGSAIKGCARHAAWQAWNEA
jgi:CRISPR/Cas system CMR subunit Cmr6 (Cas7 group RAMP superfamily)